MKDDTQHHGRRIGYGCLAHIARKLCVLGCECIVASIMHRDDMNEDISKWYGSTKPRYVPGVQASLRPEIGKSTSRAGKYTPTPSTTLLSSITIAGDCRSPTEDIG